LENLVFIELKRRNKTVYYHSQTKECDFVVCDGFQVSEVMQVCVVFETEQTKKREIAGLVEAMSAYSLYTGKIITLDTEEKLTVEDKTIDTLPVWKWLLENR
jgi:predicted AAA+ superfamily ATPase